MYPHLNSVGGPSGVGKPKNSNGVTTRQQSGSQESSIFTQAGAMSSNSSSITTDKPGKPDKPKGDSIATDKPGKPDKPKGDSIATDKPGKPDKPKGDSIATDKPGKPVGVKPGKPSKPYKPKGDSIATDKPGNSSGVTTGAPEKSGVIGDDASRDETYLPPDIQGSYNERLSTNFDDRDFMA